jgi:HK97 family phage major capsid protein
MKHFVILTAVIAVLVAFAFNASLDQVYMLAPAAVLPLDELSAEIKRIVSEFGTKTNELSDAIAKADSEVKEHGKVADETKGLIADLSTKMAANEQTFEARLHAIEQLADERKNKGTGQKKTLGDMVVEAKQLKDFANRQGVDGNVVKLRSKGVSDQIDIECKDVTSGAASAGDGIWSFRDPELVSDPYRPRMIRELIPTIPVGSNLIEWVQTNVRTNNADAVSETVAKPKSDLTYDRKETPVRKIAHYFKTSAEVLADFARLRGEINNEGFEMLRQVEEDQLMSGDGTGVNLLGLIPQATAYNPASTQVGDQQVDVIRRAILQVRQSYYSATGIVLNPADWAAIELLKSSNDDRYLFSNATSGAPARLWGLPVSESDALPAGEFMVGAFRTAATIYDRMVATVYVSTENEDDFITNMVSILFEERLALAVKRPLAFVHGNLDGAT